MMIFKNQTIVISGGASGIGLEVAKKVMSNNGTAIIVDRNNETLNNLKLEKFDNFLKSQADVTDENQLKEVLLKHKDKVPPITGLVCSAGKAPVPKRIEDTEIKEWNEIIQSHLTGTFITCKIFGSHMAQNGFGSIVNISSVVGYNSGPVLAYGAAKAGIINLTSALSIQWAKDKVRVNAVAPGAIETQMVTSLKKEINSLSKYNARMKAAHPIGRIGLPQEVANLICFLASDDASFMTGSTVPIDGGRSIR